MTRHTLSLLLLPLALLACGDKEDTAATDDTAADTTLDADCIAGDMTGDWYGYTFGNEAVPQTLSLEASANEGESMGLNVLDTSYSGDGNHCTFQMDCMTSDGETLEVYNVIVEAVPETGCIEGAYTLSLFSADELLVQYFDPETSEMVAEGILTR
ncbi:MAG: hypothetical protein ACI8RZ_000971 [Myxococcota bacterium]|jgi:hypothetical protein